jgi:hypothetical protein
MTWNPGRYDADEDDENRDSPFILAMVKARHGDDADRLTVGNLLVLAVGLAGLTFAWWLWSR